MSARIKRISITIIGCVAFSSSLIAAPVTARDCQKRLAEIASGKLSGDDTLVLNDCLLNGFISSGDVQRSYDRAKAHR